MTQTERGASGGLVFARRLLLLISFAATPAFAQRADNNAITASDDAFGRALGNEKIGIYTVDSVRGFNPVEAGNVRIEGLYFDQQSTPSSRLVDSSAVRVGYAARGYPFPAPTGIADLQIDRFKGQQLVSAEFEGESYRNHSGSIQAKVPLAGDRLGLSAGIGYRSARVPHGRDGNYLSVGANMAWVPYRGAQVIAFVSRYRVSEMRASPILFPAGNVVPSRVVRRAYLGQPWARGLSIGITNGAIAKLPLGSFRLEAGLFRNVKDDPRSFADLELGVARDGAVANRIMVADINSRSASTSGEIRLVRVWSTGKARHSIVASLRARRQERTFGGQQRLSLGPSVAGRPDHRPEPLFGFGADDHSQVRQYTYGIGYDLQRPGLGSIGLALQRSDYRKATRFADPARPPTTSGDQPILLSANGTVELLAGLMAYGGYVRGLEESAAAPDIAINRNEAPPALRTSQMDAGFRYAILPGLSVIAGVFHIRKPYFNLDPSGRFRQLGKVANRGIEASLTGQLMPGLTIVAGGLLLDSRVSGEAVVAGIIGPRPVGSIKRHAIANLDWKPVGQERWSFDLAFESFSPAAADRLNNLTAPARETLAAGARYRFRIGDAKILVRGQITNLFNDYGWKVSSSGGFTYTLPRTAFVSLTADF